MPAGGRTNRRAIGRTGGRREIVGESEAFRRRQAPMVVIRHVPVSFGREVQRVAPSPPPPLPPPPSPLPLTAVAGGRRPIHNVTQQDLIAPRFIADRVYGSDPHELRKRYFITYILLAVPFARRLSHARPAASGPSPPVSVPVPAGPGPVRPDSTTLPLPPPGRPSVPIRFPCEIRMACSS